MMMKTLGNHLIPTDCIESCKFNANEGTYTIKALGQTFYAQKADAYGLLPKPILVPAEAGTWALDPESGDRTAPIVAWDSEGSPILGDPELYPIEMPDGRVVDDTHGVLDSFKAWREVCDEQS